MELVRCLKNFLHHVQHAGHLLCKFHDDRVSRSRDLEGEKLKNFGKRVTGGRRKLDFPPRISSIFLEFFDLSTPFAGEWS